GPAALAAAGPQVTSVVSEADERRRRTEQPRQSSRNEEPIGDRPVPRPAAPGQRRVATAIHGRRRAAVGQSAGLEAVLLLAHDAGNPRARLHLDLSVL